MTVLMVLVAVVGAIIVDNTAPKLDIHGEIVNGHDGSYRHFGEYWYYHAMAYSLCHEPAKLGCDQTGDHCGFQRTHNVSTWRSKDLTSGSWEHVGDAVRCADVQDCKIMYRPHVVFNPSTGLYVLFYNFVSDKGYGGYGVRTSESPEGPFVERTHQMNITRLCPGPVAQEPCGPAQGGAGDYSIFVDDDGAGYLIYSAQFYMSIEELTPDFLNSTGRNASCGGKFGGAVFPEYFVEAPVLFKRGEVYYALYGHCCCFCYQGSGILVYTAPHPLGPWSPQPGGDLACRPAGVLANGTHGIGGEPTPGQGCLYNGQTQKSTTRSQQNFVIEVPVKSGSTTEISYVWTGDRWQQSPDGLKGHEGQFWVPLDFTSNGSIAKVDWVDSFHLDLA